MSTMLQIRNVPGELHRRLKVRAALEGISMSEFALREIRRGLDRPHRSQVLDKIAELSEVYLPRSAEDLVRDERDKQ